MGDILVGYDGSPQAMEALRWAAAEAERREATVLVVESWHQPILDDRAWIEVREDLDAGRRQVEARLAEVTDAVASEHAGVGFRHLLVEGRPGDVLVELSKEAMMVVVGARGRGGFAGLLLGSVSRRVASSAHSPVVVVRGDARRDGDVVVGVQGLPWARRALAWAADAARRRGGRLRAVMAWSYLLPEGPGGPEPFRPGYSDADAQAALRAIVDEVLGPDPGVELELETPCDLPARALIERSSDAALVVVGRNDSSRHLVGLGSVTAQVLRHVACPIAVVRGHDGRS